MLLLAPHWISGRSSPIQRPNAEAAVSSAIGAGRTVLEAACTLASLLESLPGADQSVRR